MWLYWSNLCHISVLDVCVVYLLCENVFLRLKRVPVLESFVTAGLGVTAVLQRPSFLFQTDHLIFAYPTQISVQLSHWQTYQLLIGKTLIHPALKEKETIRGKSERFVTEWTQSVIMTIKASSSTHMDKTDKWLVHSGWNVWCTEQSDENSTVTNKYYLFSVDCFASLHLWC